MLTNLTRIRDRRTGRCSSWNTEGRNHDHWFIEPGQSRVLADITGPAQITHIWMTQRTGYRECLLKITFDNARHPQVLVPLGDFFCLGHGIVNSFQSLLFSASTDQNNRFDAGCALNSYAPMPFRERAVVELINQGTTRQRQFFYIDFETLTREDLDGDLAYFHAENPVRFQKEIKVTIECGHANNLSNELSSVAYWYADRPTRVAAPPPMAKRLPVLSDNRGNWIDDAKRRCPGKAVAMTPEMRRAVQSAKRGREVRP